MLGALRRKPFRIPKSLVDPLALTAMSNEFCAACMIPGSCNPGGYSLKIPLSHSHRLLYAIHRGALGGRKPSIATLNLKELFVELMHQVCAQCQISETGRTSKPCKPQASHCPATQTLESSPRSLGFGARKPDLRQRVVNNMVVGLGFTVSLLGGVQSLGSGF